MNGNMVYNLYLSPIASFLLSWLMYSLVYWAKLNVLDLVGVDNLILPLNNNFYLVHVELSLKLFKLCSVQSFSE